VQGLGLLAWASPAHRERLRVLAGAIADPVPPSLRLGRRELMTHQEAHRGVHSPPPRAI